MTLSVPDSTALPASPGDTQSAANTANGQNIVHSIIARPVVMNCLLLGVLLIATLFGYKDVLFSWFSGDDFVHLCWLAKAVNDPMLVLHNFYANWLDAFGSAFYRPLVSVTLYFDYLIWHNNGLGFHITNFALHFMTVVFLYLFVQELQVASAKKQNVVPPDNYVWPFFAAALFALHPVHPEVVSWIIGRVDSCATAFVMATLYFYARWRATDSRVALGFGVASMVLALCSKEIAVLLAPVLTMYELCFGPGKSTNLVARLKELKPLIGFWALLAGYFLLRQLTLGTWLGGYDNTLGLGIPFSQWLALTGKGLMITFIPVNADVISKSNALIRMWTYGSAVCGIILLALAVQRKFLREIIFSAAFFILALVPVYKIFYVLNSNLEASRYAYLLTVPICMFLGLAVSQLPVPARLGKRVPLISRTIFGIAMLIAGLGLLRFNNIPWHEAGVTANAVQSELERILGPARETVPGNVVLVGPPDAFKGAYICRNAIDFMTEHLKIDPKRSSKVVAILDKQKIFPMSNIRSVMETRPQDIEIWHWKSLTKSFERVQPLIEKRDSDRAWPLLNAFPGLASIPHSFDKILRWDKGALMVDAKKEAVVVQMDLTGLSTWDMNFLTMTVNKDSDCQKNAQICLAVPGDHGNVFVEGAPIQSLAASSEVGTKTSTKRSSETVSKTATETATETETLVFPLRNVPAWALNYTKTLALPIIFCTGWKGKVLELKSIPPREIMPLTSLRCFGGGNFYRLWSQEPEGVLSVDVSSIKGATGWELEEIATLDQFSRGNPTEPELSSKLAKFDGTHANYKLHLHDRAEGYYCLRVWALDKNKQRLGVGSDHYRVQFKD